MALMIITDRLLVADYYQNKPTQAWIVSSVLGSFFGLLLSAFIWAGFSLWDPHTNLLGLALELFWWRGAAAILVGAAAIQILKHYFCCFVEDAHAASIAAWLSAAPIFILLSVTAVSVITGEALPTLMKTESLWFIGAILATAGLVWFELLMGGSRKMSVGSYWRDLALMLFWSVVYSIGLRVVLVPYEGSENLQEAIALLPYYWLGFAAGSRMLFHKEERMILKQNWFERMHQFIGVILFVEVIGMFVFFFEFFGLSGLDPVYVNIIVGSHIFIVYGLTLLLGALRLKLERGGVSSFRFLNAQLQRENLPKIQKNTRLIIFEISALVLVVAGIVLTSLYSFL